jgi:hypothetical protein
MGLDLEQAEFEDLEQAHWPSADDHGIGGYRGFVRVGCADDFAGDLGLHAVSCGLGRGRGFT